MAKVTVESLKKRKDIDKKIDDLADIIAQGFYELDTKIEGTKTELKAEIQDVRTELRGEIQEVRIELKNEIKSIESRLSTDILTVHAQLRSIKQEISEINDRVEYIYKIAMKSDDILVESFDKLRNRVKKPEKQVAYLQVNQK